jgi:adenylate cyclase
MCIVMVGIVSYISEISFLELIEAKTIDLRFRSRGQISPSSKVVIAAIDEKSLDREGKWVWPRSKIADLVTRLSEAGASVIVLDIVFSEPDKLQAYNDAVLADAIRKSRSKVVLGFFFHMTSEGLGHIDKKELDRRKQDIEGGRYRFLNLDSGDAQSLNAIEAAIPESNITDISRSTNYTGFFNVWQDSDGVVRAVPTIVKYDSAFYAPLTLVTMSAYWGDPLSIASYMGSIQSVHIGTLSIPTNPLGKMLINYRGEQKTIPHISVTDILNNNVSDSALRDKVVIVGATAIGLCDIRVTPFSTNFPAPEIHANIVDNILSKDFIREPPWSAAWDIMAMIVLGLFLAFLLPRFGFTLSAVTPPAIFVGYILLCQYLFSNMGLILNLVYPLTVAVLVYIGITTYGRYSLRRGKAKNANPDSQKK